MTKFIALLSRKPGMSFEDFKTYYEEKHVPLICELNPWMSDYRRNYIDLASISGGMNASIEWLPDFDVITEIWFESREAFDKGRTALTAPAAALRIANDEANFLDRSRKRMFFVDEL